MTDSSGEAPSLTPTTRPIVRRRALAGPFAAGPLAGRVLAARLLAARLLAACLLAACLQCRADSPSMPDPPVRFDFEPRAFLPADHYVKDHTIVLDDDVFHIFYTTGTDTLGRWRQPGNEIDFGHASSPDLRHWRIHPRIATWPRARWEARNRWAPHVVGVGNRFRMYYTGVNENIAQSIGIAESDDLYAWRQLEAQPFHPAPTWARWDEARWSDCRDPFVFRADGLWWMTYTAMMQDGVYAIGLARSDDGLAWQDDGPLLVGQTGEPLESSQLIELDGRWFLLFTSGRESGTWVIEGPSHRGPWDFAARRRWLDSIAPEITRDGNGLWISTHDSYRRPDRVAFLVLIEEARLSSAGLEIVPEPSLGPDWPEIEGDAFTHQPILDDVLWIRGEPRIGHRGNGWVGTAESFTRPSSTPGEHLGGAPVGVARSVPFLLSSPTISLLIGGSSNAEAVYVALRRQGDAAFLFKETGSGTDPFSPRRWDAHAHVGQMVYLELADLDPAGHLNVDEIVFGQP